MSRVEISQSEGPDVKYSWDDSCGGSCETLPSRVDRYTLHSYQFIHSSGGSTVDVTIFGSNYSDENNQPSLNNLHWSEIYSESLPSGSSLAYSNFWNFKFAKVSISGSTSANILIAEKHNP